MVVVLRVLLFLLLGIIIVIFGLYGAIVLYYGRLKRNERERKHSSDGKFKPFVSVVIPTHNEEMIVSKKIENIFASDYPHEKLEVIFVDDSDDSTPEIIGEYSKQASNIHLIRFHNRMGYSPSMIFGCKAAKGEIVIMNDAGSFLDSKAITYLVANFQDPTVGVVTGKSVILNVSEDIGESESLYQKMYNFLRTAETNMDSTFYIKGEATGVRKDLIGHIGACTETFDTTAGLFVRQKGHRVIYDSNVKFYEYAPSTRSGRIKQKTIRAANLIKVLWRFRHMMFKREHGKYGYIILPFNFAMLSIAPTAILTAFELFVILSLFDISSYIVVWAFMGWVFLFLLVFSRHLLFTFLEFELSLLKALWQVVFTKRTHDKINKVASTRR